MRHWTLPRLGMDCLAFLVALLPLASHTFAHAQSITDIEPRSAPPSAIIAIIGSGFGNDKGTVTFGGIQVDPSQIQTWTPTVILLHPYALKDPVVATLNVAVTPAGAKLASNSIPFEETVTTVAAIPAPAAVPAPKPAAAPTPHASAPAPVMAASPAPTDPAVAPMLVASTAPISAPVPDTPAAPRAPALPPAAAPTPLTLSPNIGYGPRTITLTLSGGAKFPASQGADVLQWNGTPVTVDSNQWKADSITIKIPKLAPGAVPVTIDDGAGTTLYQGTFTYSAATARLNHIRGVAGDTVTISGAGLPDFSSAAQKGAQVLFDDTPATIQTTPAPNANSVTVAAPDFHVPSGGENFTISVQDSNGDTVAVASDTYTEYPKLWGDKDESPLDVKFVAGYEQGYLASQGSNNDAFVAVYGRKIFGQKSLKFGPFFAFRLLTAPQTGDNLNITSVLSSPTTQIQAKDFSGVGSAVDFTAGLEWQFAKLSQGRTTLSAIFGGGFTTPRNGNAITQTYVMPHYGTIECSTLQSRLAMAKYFDSNTGKGNAYYGYQNIQANLNGTWGSGCYYNATDIVDSAAQPINQLDYAALDTLNFFPKYLYGLRIINRWPGTAGGPSHCTETAACTRGYVDFTIGQNANLTAGKLIHQVLTVDSTYPFPVPSLNYIYLFGTFAKRVHNLPKPLEPLALQPATASTGTASTSTFLTPPDPQLLVLPFTQPDRDFYRFGAGIDILKVFTGLAAQSKTP